MTKDEKDERFKIRKSYYKDRSLADDRIKELRSIVSQQNQRIYALKNERDKYRQKVIEKFPEEYKPVARREESKTRLENIYFCVMCRCLEEKDIFKLKSMLEEAINTK